MHPMNGPVVEPLESRTLLSASIQFPVPAPVDVSRLAGPEAEESIAVDPTNPKRIFVASNRTGGSLFGASSSDSGATWTGREFATGMDGLPRACCDPSAAYDSFGNLFFAYLNAVNGRIEMLVSTDNGQNFTYLTEFTADGDQPTVATGPGTVWVAFQREASGAIAYKAKVSGLGGVGKFKSQRIIGGEGQNVGDIAIGPAGQVLVGYQVSGGNPEGASTIVTQLDPDGTGPRRVGKQVVVGNTNIGDFDKIPAQIRRSIDAEVGLAYDRSGGPYTGRVYLVYTDETPDESNNTDIVLRYSDNDGQSWSPPVRVNDDSTVNSQFFPRIAVDAVTGNVAISWYDARNDTGVTGSGSKDLVANNDVQFYAVVGSPTADGLQLSANVQITAGVSTTVTNNNPNDFGDYTGLAIFNGQMHPAWADNSNSTGDNPDGAGGPLDLYTTTMTVLTDAPIERGAPIPQLVSKPTAGAGRSYNFAVRYNDPAGQLNLGTFDGADMQITAPNGFVFQPTFVKAHRRGAVVTASYRFAPPGGPRAVGPGTYTIGLQGNQVANLAGQFAAARSLFGTFMV
jgi:hypothetical protein